METRKVSILVGGKICSFYTDDPEEYISELAQRVNTEMKLTESFSGSSSYTNAVLSMISLTDHLMRTEQKVRELTEKSEQVVPESKPAASKKKSTARAEDNHGQISVWDVLAENSRDKKQKQD